MCSLVVSIMLAHLPRGFLEEKICKTHNCFFWVTIVTHPVLPAAARAAFSALQLHLPVIAAHRIGSWDGIAARVGVPAALFIGTHTSTFFASRRVAIGKARRDQITCASAYAMIAARWSRHTLVCSGTAKQHT